MTMRPFAAVSAVLLLLPACAGDIPVAPACDAPATVERALTNVFTAVTTRGAAALGGRVQLDREAGIITAGTDSVRFRVAGDTLMLRAAADSAEQAALILSDIRTTEENTDAGSFRCEAQLEAPYWGGGTRPLRYITIISPDDEHVVAGSVLGEPEEVPF